MGNGEAKELKFMTHGLELSGRVGNAGRWGRQCREEGVKREKKLRQLQ